MPSHTKGSKVNLSSLAHGGANSDKVYREIRQSVTKFHMSGHKFPIESDRYLKIPKELRICDICGEGIGDEYHCFLHCNHVLLELSKDNFTNKIRNINESLMLLDSHSLIVKVTMMSDRNITDISAKFIHELMTLYELVAAKCCFKSTWGLGSWY